MWYSIKKGNHTDGTPISITCGAKFYSRIGNHTVGTPRSIICGAKFCQYDILSRTGNHTDRTSINITCGTTFFCIKFWPWIDTCENGLNQCDFSWFQCDFTWFQVISVDSSVIPDFPSVKSHSSPEIKLKSPLY